MEVLGDNIRKFFIALSILALLMLPVSTLYDPEVLSRSLGMAERYGILPKFIDDTIVGTKNYFDSKDGSGQKFTGQWKNGKFHGKGIYVTLNGIFDCTWMDGLKHGKCTVTIEDKVIYNMTYKNDKRDGQGTRIWPKGGKYTGSWKEDRRHGQGTMLYSSGNTYAGSWDSGYSDGHGIYTWSKGDSFEGEFKGGKLNGPGIYTWADGSKYIGTWLKNKKHGKGTFIDSDGKTYAEVWKNGERIESILQ